MNIRYTKACLPSEDNRKVTPSAWQRLEATRLEARDCMYSPCNRQEHLVNSEGKKYVVNLKSWTCSCKRWQISGIPCKHVVCCLGHTRESVEDYCHEYFSVKRLLDTYSELMHLVAEVDLKPTCITENIQPLLLKRLPRRPTTSSIRREPGEAVKGIKRSSTNRCTTYQGIGHNKRRCQREPPAPKKGAARGAGGGAGSRTRRGAGKGVGRGRGSTALRAITLVMEAAANGPNKGVRAANGSASDAAGKGRGRGRTSKGRGKGKWQLCQGQNVAAVEGLHSSRAPVQIGGGQFQVRRGSGFQTRSPPIPQS